MGLAHHPNVVSDGLIFCADPANKRCYSGSGDTCTDLAGGVTGSLENDTSLSSDWNGVFDFDGTDDYIDFGSPAALQNQVGTVIAWGRWDDTSTAQGGLVSYIYNHDSLAHGWNLLNHGTYKIGRSLAGSSYDYWGGSSSYKFDKDEWVMASFSFAGNTNPVITYRNDVAINTDSSQGTTLTYTGANLLIARTDTAVHRQEWFGQIGPVYIYNRVLTQDEITQMYEALKPRFEPRITKSGLVGNWDAGDPNSYSGGTTTWKDTANGYAGALQNMEAADFNLSNGGYLEFDGTDEYVNIGHVGFLSEGTIELWIRYDTAPVEQSNYREWGGNDYFEVRHSSVGYGGASTWDISANTMHSVKNSWSTAVWYHEVWTWKYSSTTGSIYFNGEFDVTGTINQDPSALASSNDMYIMRSSSTYAGYVPGKLAVFRVYNRALSAAEILDNYNKTKARFGH